jgi:putative SbcD/Mre11-related phosphoesterase
MHSKFEPIPDYPALQINTNSETALIIADLHLGVEHSFIEAGVRIPNRTWKLQEKLIELLEKYNISRLIVLGDIKHTVPSTSWQETQELPEFFRGLMREVDQIDIVLGNHDTNLKNILPEDIEFHDASGWKYNDMGLAHGHKWPDKDIVENEVIVLAHNHPTVVLVDELEVRHSYPCWVRGSPIKTKFTERYGDDLKVIPSELILIPSFLEFGSGTAVNSPDTKPLGPLLKNGLMDLPNSKVYLLDGSYLGLVKKLMLD